MKRKFVIALVVITLAMSIMLAGCVGKYNYYATPKNTVVESDDKVFDNNAGVNNNGADKEGSLVDKLIAVKPSARQLAYSEVEYYNFIHFGMNTFTGNEWGEGQDSPSLFNPTNLDTDQWCEALKASGSKGVIFTAKHHDGFCLWNSAYTDYDIANSPYKDGKGDIVRELSDSAAKYGLKFGIYLSPWDRHDARYGKAGYNEYFVNQLTELMTNYGEIFNVWFDGARGADAVMDEGWDYDWDAYYNVVYNNQPNAVISNCGNDVRWVGNEAGHARNSEWSVISAGREANPEYQMSEEDAKRLAENTFDTEDKGSRELLNMYKDLKWYPAEVDVSIRKGWFYHEEQKPKKIEHLMQIYYRAVGGNSSLLLNVPPNKEGRIDDSDVATLKALGDNIKASTANKVTPVKTTVGTIGDMREDNALLNLQNDDKDSSFAMGAKDGVLQFDLGGLKSIKRIDIREDLRYSQRIEYFDVWGREESGKWRLISNSTNVGNRRSIIINPKQKRQYDSVRIVVKQSRSNAVIRNISIYE